MELTSVFNVLMHQGLTTYKTKNSMATLPSRVAAEKQDKLNKKGAIFAVRSKEDFFQGGVKGFIIKSKEALLEQANNLTHFTPNVYGKASYTDEKRTQIKGFEEQYLNQINTFVVDIDTKKHSVQDILVASMEKSIGAPTLIVESTNGYQAFFALESPFFITNKNDFRGLKIAKRISDNIKRSLAEVDVDIFCNDFGFFRIPNDNNIVWFQEQYTYAIADLIDWSMRQDDDFGRSLYVVQKQLTNAVEATSTEWFHALLKTTDVKGHKGQIGRNNMMYTLALICYSEGKAKGDTFDLLDTYNSNLKNPLKSTEIKAVIRSAFSGKHAGASKAYVQSLLAAYVQNGTEFDVQLSGRTGWYKFKKEREDRVRSHLHEWEDDIVQYINAHCTPETPYFEATQKELCEEIGISVSTLNKLMKQSTRLVKRASKGRNAVTQWSSLEMIIKHTLTLIQVRQNATNEQIQALINDVLEPVVVTAAKIMLQDVLQSLVPKHEKTARRQPG